MEFVPLAMAAAVAVLMTLQMASRPEKPKMKFWMPVVAVEALAVYALLQALVFCIPTD
jgi:hypothetical protein